MNISDLSLFIRIVETGSITESAKQLDVTPAAISYALKRLEKQLGFQLLIRSTRQLRITNQGENFLFYCRKALDTLEKGKLAAHEMQSDVTGELRLSAPSDLGRNIVFPWIDDMVEQYPGLSIDLNVVDSLSNFFMDQVDVALRYGKPLDSTMVAFHIATVERITCASVSYLQQYGTPKHPEDLRKHNCLLYRRDGRLFSNWEYTHTARHHKIRVTSNRMSNDTDIIRRWAINGKGVTHRSQLDLSIDILNGNLVQLLTDYTSPPVELYLICPSRKQVTPAVIAFRELLREKCAQTINAMSLSNQA